MAFSGAGEKAGIGAETQIHARFSDKSLARNTGVRRDHKNVNKVKGPRPAAPRPSIAPKMWQVCSQRHEQIRPPQRCTFLPQATPMLLPSPTVSSITREAECVLAFSSRTATGILYSVPRSWGGSQHTSTTVALSLDPDIPILSPSVWTE